MAEGNLYPPLGSVEVRLRANRMIPPGYACATPHPTQPGVIEILAPTLKECEAAKDGLIEALRKQGGLNG